VKLKRRILPTCLLASAFLLTGCCLLSEEPCDEETTAPPPQKQTVKAEKTGFWWPSANRNASLNWTSMAYPTGDPLTSVVGIEKGVPGEVHLNQPFDYEIIVTNLTNMTIEDVVVTDQLDNNFKFNHSNPDALSGGGGLYTWALGTLDPAESKIIIVNATATSEGLITSCAMVSYSSLLCSSIPVVQPKLQLTKTGPAEVLRCDQFTYYLAVTNNGTGSFKNVVITDPLPSGIQTTDGKQNVNISVDGLDAGQTRKYEVTVEAVKAGRFTNMATATGDGAVETESESVTTTVREPKLAITKNGPKKLYLGRDVTYDIVVRNTGDGEARNTMITDTIPAGARFVRASDGGKLVDGIVQWSIGTLTPNGSRKVNVTFGVDEIGTLKDMAKASAYCAEAVSATAETEFAGIPAILLEVVDIEDPIMVGDNVTYVITVTNQGSAIARDVAITCDLESEMQFVSAEGATAGSARGMRVKFSPLAALAPKTKATWRVVVKATAEGDVRFSTSMTSKIITRPVEETESTHFYE